MDHNQILTKSDLRELEDKLFSIISELQNTRPPSRRWLKSKDVRKLLGISPGTLQNLRVNGSLPFSKVGNIIFYNYEDIVNLINSNMSS